MSDLIAAVGRIFMSVVFVIAGYGKLTNIEGTASYIGTKIPAIPQLEQALGMDSPMIYAYASGVVELLGGILLIVGLFTRTAAVALVIYCALIILYFHHFWDVDVAQFGPQRTQALKNLAIMGGLLMLALYGPGRYAVGGGRKEPEQMI